MDSLISDPLWILTQVTYVVITARVIFSLLRKSNEYKELLMSSEKTILEQHQVSLVALIISVSMIHADFMLLHDPSCVQEFK